jgi:hypothetical protein
MTAKIPRVFGSAGVTAAGVALAACVYTVSLPYRLSSFQYQLLRVAAGTQVITSLAAILTGIVAVITGARRLGVAAIILGAVALLLAVGTAHFHSTSPKLSGDAMPNHPMSRTAGSAFSSTARAGVIAALPAVGYLERWARTS